MNVVDEYYKPLIPRDWRLDSNAYAQANEERNAIMIHTKATRPLPLHEMDMQHRIFLPAAALPESHSHAGSPQCLHPATPHHRFCLTLVFTTLGATLTAHDLPPGLGGPGHPIISTVFIPAGGPPRP